MINLRGPNARYTWWHYERQVCAAPGIAHLDVMLSSRRVPRPECCCDLLDAFDTAPRPFLLKCSGGQDRTSLAAALYLIHRNGWDALDAAESAIRALAVPAFPQAHATLAEGLS